jgi:Photosynthesis affected mutant 68
MPDASPERLPFEPRKKRPKPEGAATSGANAPSKPAQGSTAKKSSPPKSPKQKPEKSAGKSESDRDNIAKQNRSSIAKQNREDLAIPEVVSSRMIRRMALLSGVPILLGVMTFVGSYYIVVNDIFELPNTAVLLVSMGWFGLGVLGLSYGVISASWEEETSGSLVGWSEFTINFQRLVGAWQEARQKSLK